MSITDEVRARRSLPPPALRRLIRVTAGVSLRRMARELDVEPSTVGRWESGAATPRPEALARYVELLEQLQQELAS